MLSWWHRDVIAADKLPLMLCFVSFVLTFVSTRAITRLIRDGRGPFRNVTAGGTHIHHSVPGIILLMIGAFTAVGGPGTMGWLSFSAIAVGIGTSLVLDEFALILHLQDVYWSGEGQFSVEAVSLVAACLGLAMVGFSPVRVADVDSAELSLRISATGVLVIDGCRGKQLEHATRRAADFDRRWKPVQADWEDFIGGRPSQPNTAPSPPPEASRTAGGDAPDDPPRGEAAAGR